jgi:hypothetical protein
MTRRLSPLPPSSKLFSSKGSSMGRSSDKKRIKSASFFFGKLQQSFADASTMSLTVGPANAPGARLLFATIDADTSTSKEIAAVVVASTTIAITTTVGLPTGRQNATVVTAQFAMGIALATISLESGSPRLTVRKTARVSSLRARCTAPRVARQSTVGPNVQRTRPTRRSRQQSAPKRTTRTTSAALRATPQASATIVRRWRATDPVVSTMTVARTTPTTKTTSPSPFWPRLASKPSARYLPKRSLPLQCPSRIMAPTTMRHWPNLVSWRHHTPQLPWWRRNATVPRVPRALNATP